MILLEAFDGCTPIARVCKEWQTISSTFLFMQKIDISKLSTRKKLDVVATTLLLALQQEIITVFAIMPEITLIGGSCEEQILSKEETKEKPILKSVTKETETTTSVSSSLGEYEGSNPLDFIDLECTDDEEEEEEEENDDDRAFIDDTSDYEKEENKIEWKPTVCFGKSLLTSGFQVFASAGFADDLICSWFLKSQEVACWSKNITSWGIAGLSMTTCRRFFVTLLEHCNCPKIRMQMPEYWQVQNFSSKKVQMPENTTSFRETTMEYFLGMQEYVSFQVSCDLFLPNAKIAINEKEGAIWKIMSEMALAMLVGTRVE